MKNRKDYERNDGNGVVTITSLAALLTPEELSPITAALVRDVLIDSTDAEFIEAFDGATKSEVREYLDAYELCRMPYWGAEELASAIHAADSGRAEKLVLRAVTLAQKANELPDTFTPKQGVEWAMDRGYLFGYHARLAGAAIGTYGHPHNPLSDGPHHGQTAPAVDAATPVASEIKTTTAPVPKQRAQENRILELLASKGHDPMKLPDREPGRPGVKSEIRALALVDRGLYTAGTFDDAWQRLRDDDRVAGGE